MSLVKISDIEKLVNFCLMFSMCFFVGVGAACVGIDLSAGFILFLSPFFTSLFVCFYVSPGEPPPCGVIPRQEADCGDCREDTSAHHLCHL